MALGHCQLPVLFAMDRFGHTTDARLERRPIHPLKAIEMQFQTRMGTAQPNLTHTQDAGRRLWGTQRSTPLRPPSRRGRTIQQPQPGSDSVSLEAKFKV